MLTISALSISPGFRLLPARGDGFGGVDREAGLEIGEFDLASPSTVRSSLDFGGVIIPTSGVPCRLPLAEIFDPSRLLEMSWWQVA